MHVAKSNLGCHFLKSRMYGGYKQNKVKYIRFMLLGIIYLYVYITYY